MVDAFAAHLELDGWSVEYEVDQCDAVAKRGDQTLYAEAKGRTAAIGLDVDTMFGQLLRRMKQDPGLGDHYAAVLPSEAEAAAMRVPERVRRTLGIKIFLVSPENEVREVN